MNLFIIRRPIYVFLIILLAACKFKNEKETGKGEGNPFEIHGAIANSNARMIYLEEVPPGASQGTIIDSSAIGKNGQYKLQAKSKESMVYNLRLDENAFPLAAVINDVPDITLNIELSKENNQFAEKYDVKGSPVSQEMKDFMFSFNGDLQKIYAISHQLDSLHKKNVPDSTLGSLDAERKQLSDKIRTSSLAALQATKDPALFLFELGYYQSTANGAGFGLEPIDIEQVTQLINEAATRFPGHQGLNAVKDKINEQLATLQRSGAPKWVGKQAPDFSLPDPNGKDIKLSSFRGKYVLVDFWASWCGPCRAENPSVVKAYNKFKNKNFAILGVSLDNPGDKDEWMKAVMKDNLTWTQVSDLKGWQSIVVPIYDFGEIGIPYNILVDPSGTVIGERLRGPALEAKLGEVLK